MRRLLTALAFAALSSEANAAMLISCSIGTSPMGAVVWIGTYRMLDGTVSVITFPQSQYTYCPAAL